MRNARTMVSREARLDGRRPPRVPMRHDPCSFRRQGRAFQFRKQRSKHARQEQGHADAEDCDYRADRVSESVLENQAQEFHSQSAIFLETARIVHMGSSADALALLKVLIAAAWTDGRLSQAEMNYVKNLAKRFRLSGHDWLQLEPLLEDPPLSSEIDLLFKDLLARIGTPSGRDSVIGHIEAILKADAQITAEEHDFLEQSTFILKEASTVELLVRRMKTLFQKRPPAGVTDLDEFIRNKIFFKLRRRLGSDRLTPEMYQLCLLGGLMGIIAQADGEIDPREMEEIRRQIQYHGHFDPETVDLLSAIIEEESIRGLDRARLIAAYTEGMGFEPRVHLLDLLFAVAAANGSLTYAELEILRSISSAMGLSHRQYIDCKLKARCL
jgi:uncharacterized tellurite resistance protein B-like protein